MRAVMCVVMFSLVLCPGGALKCYDCYSKGSELCDQTRVQTCSLLQNACGAYLSMCPLEYSFRSCMNMAVCQGWISTPGAFANCCSTDLCN
uniref:Uncharacterized protein n=1 Tax=Neogobius melanostomus TaxID=47308 RepID=A0A8C6U0I4_9GOBI